jgi:hypothetical protein
MPKHSSTDVLKRWRELDWELARGKLVVARFAEKWGVNPATVRRDLKAFKAMKQRILQARDEKPELKRGEIARERWLVYGYDDGQECLFVINVSSQLGVVGQVFAEQLPKRIKEALTGH